MTVWIGCQYVHNERQMSTSLFDAVPQNTIGARRGLWRSIQWLPKEEWCIWYALDLYIFVLTQSKLQNLDSMLLFQAWLTCKIINFQGADAEYGEKDCGSEITNLTAGSHERRRGTDGSTTRKRTRKATYILNAIRNRITLHPLRWILHPSGRWKENGGIKGER